MVAVQERSLFSYKNKIFNCFTLPKFHIFYRTVCILSFPSLRKKLSKTFSLDNIFAKVVWFQDRVVEEEVIADSTVT